MKLHELVEKIESFRTLKKNWDSYNGNPIKEPTIKLALSIAHRIDIKQNWFVSPCGSGEIHFESKKGSYISIW